MIIVKLLGGLGNQMFQYAFAKRLAHVNRLPLKLDLSEYQSLSQLRNYELSCFNVTAEIATSDEISSYINYGPIHRFCRKIKMVFNLPLSGVIMEHQFSFDKSIAMLTGGAYVYGYWQSEKYFSDIQHVIRNDFTFSIDPDANNQ